MSKSLRNLVFIVLFLAPSSLFGIKIQTSDEVEFDIELHVAQQSETLKKMIEDIGEDAEQSIPLPKISKKQFDLLLPAMLQLAQLHTTLPQTSEEEKLAQQLQQIVADLKSNDQPLTNQQLIEFITGANFLNIPLVEPALKALARRILKKDELLQLVALEDKLKDLWHMHPAMQMLSLQHPGVLGVIESRDGKKLISWSRDEGTIKIWDKSNLDAKPIILEHYKVNSVIESMDSKNLISWSYMEGTIKVWDKNNPTKSITLKHPGLLGVIEDGKNLISGSKIADTIKIWDRRDLAAVPITREHLGIEGVIEDGKNLISWSWIDGTIKIWDRRDLAAEPITLEHLGIKGVIVSLDGNKFISWGKGTIKIWDKNDLDAEPITHKKVYGVIESREHGKLISWSEEEGTIIVWDRRDLDAEPTILKHRHISGVIESMDGKKLISWSFGEGTIKIWDGRDLEELITLKYHQWVTGVIENSDGNNLISWSWKEGTIKIWDKNNLREPKTTHRHPWVTGVIESRDGNNLISWGGGTIKIWDKAIFNPTSDLMLLLLTVYFASEGQKFELTAQELAEFKAAFTTLSPMIQAVLEKQAPDFIAAIKSAQK